MDGAQVNGLQTEEISQLREEVEELRRQQATLHTQLEEKETLITTLVGTLPSRVDPTSQATTAAIQRSDCSSSEHGVAIPV